MLYNIYVSKHYVMLYNMLCYVINMLFMLCYITCYCYVLLYNMLCLCHVIKHVRLYYITCLLYNMLCFCHVI